jgi:hypothetical protein
MEGLKSLMTQVSAATGGLDTTVQNPLASKFTNIGQIFAFVTNLLIGVGWGLVFVMLALGFMKYVTSRGEKTETQSAQQWLTYSVIGGVGLLLLGLIRTLVANILGIDVSEIGAGDLTPQ